MAIHIALAKGRIHKVVMKYLAESGYDFPTYSEESRKLIFEDAKGQLKVTLVKSPDVAVYVERGAADVGIVGKDVLIEKRRVPTSTKSWTWALDAAAWPSPASPVRRST
mgnify:CR=1 FL=1